MCSIARTFRPLVRAAMLLVLECYARPPMCTDPGVLRWLLAGDPAIRWQAQRALPRGGDHFPPEWRYDVLRALDYLRSVNAPHDPRLEDPIALVAQRADRSGRWTLARGYPGVRHFELEPTGSPSRCNTLRALRVLRWWRTPSA
jgi:hypothetical protein